MDIWYQFDSLYLHVLRPNFYSNYQKHFTYLRPVSDMVSELLGIAREHVNLSWYQLVNAKGF